MSSDVVMTMVAGKVLYENGSFFIGHSINEIYENCDLAIKTILNEVKNKAI